MATKSAVVSGVGPQGPPGQDAPPGGLWNVVDETTTDITAAVGDLVQIDMAGKSSEDEDGGVVVVQLPEATPANKGRSIAVATVNVGGALNDSLVRLQADGVQTIKQVGASILQAKNVVRVALCSTGDGWVLWSLP